MRRPNDDTDNKDANIMVERSDNETLITVQAKAPQTNYSLEIVETDIEEDVIIITAQAERKGMFGGDAITPISDTLSTENDNISVVRASITDGWGKTHHVTSSSP